MRVPVFEALMMALFASKTMMAHPDHIRGALSPRDPAMQAVEQTCAVDVETLCSSTPLVRPQDPVLDWFLGPSLGPSLEPTPDWEAPPGMLGDLDHVLRSMMDSAVRLSRDQPSFVMILEHEPPRPPMRLMEPSEQVFNSMLHKLGEEVTRVPPVLKEESVEESDEERLSEVSTLASDPIQFSKSLVQFGTEMLQREQDEDRRRMARRLTQVSPEMLVPRHQDSRPRLPFGCPKNRCLMRAFEQGAVSPACSHSLQRLDGNHIHSHTVTHHSLAMEHKEETFFGLALLYGILCLLTLVLLHRRFRKYGKKMRGNRRLKRRIMQSVYSNPTIKAAIEADLNEKLGHVPPLPPFVLADMNRKNSDWKKQWRMRKSIKIVVLIAVFILAVVNPFLAMPVLCLFAAARLISMAVCPPKMPEQCCSCCCCGVSTDNVARGNVTDAQACCCCCAGQGVCCASCSSCCGPNDDDRGSCEKQTCKQRTRRAVWKRDRQESSEEGVFAGIPIQIV